MKFLDIITVGILESPPVSGISVKCANSSSAWHKGVVSLRTSKLNLIVGFLAAVPSFGIAQSGFSFKVKDVFLDWMSYFK
jgi:hypothetical protein